MMDDNALIRNPEKLEVVLIFKMAHRALVVGKGDGPTGVWRESWKGRRDEGFDTDPGKTRSRPAEHRRGASERGRFPRPRIRDSAVRGIPD